MTASTFIQAEDFEDRLLNPHDLFLMKDDCDISVYLTKLSEFELQEFYSFHKDDASEDQSYSTTPSPLYF
jgi:hypothetical protein